MEAWKLHYNELLQRNIKAEKCLNSATPAQLAKWKPEFNKITRRLSWMITEYEISDENVLRGFAE